MAGSDAQLMYWKGQAAQWPDAFNVTTAESAFELHQTQWKMVPQPDIAPQAAASNATTSATNPLVFDWVARAVEGFRWYGK